MSTNMSEITDLVKGNSKVLELFYTDLVQPSVKAVGQVLEQ